MAENKHFYQEILKELLRQGHELITTYIKAFTIFIIITGGLIKFALDTSATPILRTTLSSLGILVCILGFVSGVTSFGLFIELDHGNVNGLVHVTSLPNDYYHFDPVSHSLKGERRGRVFQLADRAKISVSSVNVSERKIDFEWVD